VTEEALCRRLIAQAATAAISPFGIITGAEIICVAVPFCTNDEGSTDSGSTLPSYAVDSQIITPETAGVGGVQIPTFWSTLAE
jgi:hypothetical protein